MQPQRPTERASSTRGESIHARLKSATHSLHQEVERSLPLTSPELTLAIYRALLQRFHGFHAPHEQQMSALASSLPFPLRDRSARLRQDLLALELSAADVEALPRCEVPPLRRIEQLAGWLYVFEGAALGGRVVARAVQQNLGLDAASGASFFVGDGSATKSRWREVLRWLEEISLAHADPDAVLRSACDTFLRLRDWMDRR